MAFLNTVCSNDINEKKLKGSSSGSPSIGNLNRAGEHIDCTPPDFIMPGSSDRPLLPLHLANANSANAKDKMTCLKVLTTSAWNPPPGKSLFSIRNYFVYDLILKWNGQGLSFLQIIKYRKHRSALTRYNSLRMKAFRRINW